MRRGDPITAKVDETILLVRDVKDVFSSTLHEFRPP